MTPKEKANELGNKFYRGDIFTHGKEVHLLELEEARKCALICVDEIIKEFNYTSKKDEKQGYWQSVKQEIVKL